MRFHSLVLAVSSSLFVFSAAGCSCGNDPSIEDAGIDAGTGAGGGTGGGGVMGGGGGDTGGGTAMGGGGGDTGGGTGGGATGGGTGGGATGGGTGGGDTGGGTGGGAMGGGSACTSDPGCTAAATPACDPSGTNQLGTCVDIGGGCLKVQSLAACPSTLQTCAAGTNTCACPAGACTPGAATSCGSSTSIVACALDAPNGCGTYPTSSALNCPANQACTGAAPSAVCSCVVDPVCPTGAGTSCNSANTGVITCAVDANNCAFQNPPVLCAAPMTCTGTAPAVSCTCPSIATAPVVGGGCSTAGAVACETGNTNMVLTCTANGGCNSWQQTTNCSASSLICGTRGGAAACECGLNTSTTFYGDPVNGSVAGAGPFPSGLQTPTQCRLRTLTSALALANTAVATSGVTANVIATGATSTSPAVFSAETFPLTVQPNVTVSTTDPVQTPGNYVINFMNASGAASAFLLHDASTLSGVVVQQVNGPSSSSGVAVSCPNAPQGPVRISNTRVLASPSGSGAKLTDGVTIAGTCSAILTSLEVRSATQAGLRVQASLDEATTSVIGGTFEDNAAGAYLQRGTVTLNNLTIRSSLNNGVFISPQGGEVVFTQTGGLVETSVRDGLSVVTGSGATAASTITISGTEYRTNGANTGGLAAKPGLHIQGRIATLTDVNVHDNFGGGLLGEGATIDVSGNSHFDNNGSATFAGHGASFGLGSFTASQATFDGNRGAGVHVDSATVTIHGGSCNGNGAGSVNANGVEMTTAGGTLVIDRGAVIQNNVNTGIRTYGPGTVTITGAPGSPIDVSRNGLFSGGTLYPGGWFANTTVTASNVAFHDNGFHGVQVNNTGPNPIGNPQTFTNCAFTNNLITGMAVEVSERTAANTNSLNVSNSTFSGSRQGIQIGGGNVWAAFQGNTLSGNSETGLVVNATAASNLSFIGNTIVNNRTTRGVGGVSFSGSAPVGSAPAVSFAFQGNLVHHNAGHQIVVTSSINDIWDLRGTGTNSCVPASANVVACYNGVPTPSSSSVGVLAVGTVVLADGNSWQHANPVNGTDFAVLAGGFIFPSPPVANCPASNITCP